MTVMTMVVFINYRYLLALLYQLSLANAKSIYTLARIYSCELGR